jgi:PAS domain S-box-containing protein
MFGYQDAGLFRQECFHKLFPSLLKAKIQESCKEFHGNNDQEEFDHTCIAKDGKEFLVRFKTVPMSDDVHRDRKLICYIEDASKYSRQPEHQEYDHRYVKLIEDASDGIVIIQDQKIKHFNNTIVKITGYEREDVLGSNFMDFVSPAYKTIVLQNYMKRMEGKEAPSIYEIEIISRHGKYMPMEIATYVIEFNGRTADMIVVRDIAERKDAERSLIEAKLAAESANDRMNTVFHSIISGIILIDAETHMIVDANQIAEELIGLPKEKIIGNICHNYICPTQEGNCPITDLGLKIDRSERVLINKDGKKIPILKTVIPVTVSDKNYLVESFVDLTLIKDAEKNLLEAKLAAESANRSKSDFLATMSHELRTPLNSIIGFSDLIIGGSVGEITDKQKKFLGNISISGKHLLSLINNVLDLSKIEAEKMELNYEQFSIYYLINEVKQIVSPLADKKGLQIEFSMDGYLENIYADRVRFKQILFNLVSNAIKFTPSGGKVTISANLVGKMARFTVMDTGIGISEEDKSKLFQPFIQLDSATNRLYDGTGLGLTLVKRFVELHKGRIWLESNIGEGTAFTFELPLKLNTNIGTTAGTKFEEAVAFRSEVKRMNNIPESSIAEPNESKFETLVPKIMEPPHARGDELLILVVEDDDASRELLEVTLLHEGYRVASAANGKVALELAKEIKPFAITLDIMMPGMDGWGVLKQLKGEEQTNEIPVIITSMLDEMELGIVWGAVEHFIKPIQKETLLNTLEKIKENMFRSSLSVLVVDDEINAVELIAAMLNHEKFDVLTAYGGQEAIDIAFQKHPDVIVLDLMMPVISGFDVIKALKANPDTIDTPIIICTAKDLDSDDRTELDENVSCIMHKGMFTRENLIGTIRVVQKQAL